MAMHCVRNPTTCRTPRIPASPMEQWLKAAAKSRARRQCRGAELGHAGRHHRQAALHRGRRRAALHRHAARVRVFIRGPQATMYAVRPWTIRQYAGFSTAEESNAFYRKAPRPPAARACRWPSTWRPTAATTDHPARDRRCRQGGRGDRLGRGHEDPVRRQIPLDKVSVSMTMNGAVLPVLAGYVVAAEEQGVSQDKLSAGPSRTTSSRSSWSATPTSIRRSRR